MWLFDLSQIENPVEFFNQLKSESIATSLLSRGYVALELPEEVLTAFREVQISLAAFCNQSEADKLRFAKVSQFFLNYSIQ
jgi:hypothetical protein